MITVGERFHPGVQFCDASPPHVFLVLLLSSNWQATVQGKH